MAILKISWTDVASRKLNTWIDQLNYSAPPTPLDPTEQSLLFLRAVGSRASQILPAFYVFLGASQYLARNGRTYPQQVQVHSLRFSAAMTISLCCRKVFDERDRNCNLTSKRFLNSFAATSPMLAAHWNQISGTPTDDALKALELLRGVFRMCSAQTKALLTSQSLLARRVGLLKVHANREAAHLSVDPFVFDIIDAAHVVAAMTIIGAIVHAFDNPPSADSYFDGLDDAAWESARLIFPEMPLPRLFKDFDIAQQATSYWRVNPTTGLQMILNQLPTAIGWWESS